jgi:hypothetical protein
MRRRAKKAAILNFLLSGIRGTQASYHAQMISRGVSCYSLEIAPRLAAICR